MIGAGLTNSITNSSEYSMIGARTVNSIMGSSNAVIPGGYNNKIGTGSNNSFAAGSGAIVKANNPGSFVWSDGTYTTGAFSNGVRTFNIYASGGLYLNGIQKFSPSSRRYKNSINPMQEIDSENVYKLEPVKFYYNNTQATGPKEIGLIAEDVDQYYKELVVYNKDGQPESVKYRVLPVLMLNELKKLKNEHLNTNDKVENLRDDFSKELKKLENYSQSTNDKVENLRDEFSKEIDSLKVALESLKAYIKSLNKNS